MKRQIWFTSDNHFWHHNIINYCDRPFNSAEEMNEEMIKRWNKKVKKGDLIYILGDFAYAPNNDAYKKLLEKLNGIKILVKGNHDKVSEIRAINLGFNCMVREAVINIGKTRVRLSHYPYKPRWWEGLKIKFLQKFNLYMWDLRFITVRPKRDRIEWLLHGHTHQKDAYNPKYKKQIHVGVDAWDFEPVSVSKIVEIIKENS
jgi:calcineurin-like phosphoesterase family protein